MENDYLTQTFTIRHSCPLILSLSPSISSQRDISRSTSFIVGPAIVVLFYHFYMHYPFKIAVLCK